MPPKATPTPSSSTAKSPAPKAAASEPSLRSPAKASSTTSSPAISSSPSSAKTSVPSSTSSSTPATPKSASSVASQPKDAKASARIGSSLPKAATAPKPAFSSRDAALAKKEEQKKEEQAAKQSTYEKATIQEMLEAIILGAFVRLDATAELGQCILRTRDRAVWSSREPKLQQPVNSLLCFRFALDVVLRMLATSKFTDWSFRSFAGMTLSGITFDRCCLANVVFNRCDLSSSTFRSADLQRTSFVGASCNGCDFTDSNLRCADFTGCLLADVVLRGAWCGGAVFKGAMMTGCKADGAQFDDTAMGISAALEDLNGSSWRGCDLSRVAWPNHHINRACFDGARMIGMLLTSSHLSSSSFIRCDLRDVQATLCDFSDANMTSCDATGAVFDKSVFKRASLPRMIAPCSSWIECNLASALAPDSSFTRASFESADCSDMSCQSTSFESCALASCIFSRAKMNGCNFSFSRAYGAVFVASDCRGASFKVATLSGASFEAAQLDAASFVNADVQNVTFAGSRMPRIQMQQARHIKSSDMFSPRSDSVPAVFPGGCFTGCDLEHVVFDKRVELSACNFSGCMMMNCDLAAVVCRDINFSGFTFGWREGGGDSGEVATRFGKRIENCDMRGCSFNGLKIAGDWVKVNLHSMRCASATFKSASYTSCNIAHAEFDDCTLSSTVITGCPLARSQWRSCKLSGVTFASLDMVDASFAACNLASVKFLDGVNLLRLQLRDVSLSHVSMSRASATVRCSTTPLCHCSFNNVTIASSTFDDVDMSDSTMASCSSSSSIFKTPSLARAKMQACTFQECVFNSAQMRSASWVSCRLEACQLKACDVRSSTFKSCDISSVDWGLGSQSASDLHGVSFVNTAVDAAVADATMVMHYPAVPASASY